MSSWHISLPVQCHITNPLLKALILDSLGSTQLHGESSYRIILIGYHSWNVSTVKCTGSLIYLWSLKPNWEAESRWRLPGKRGTVEMKPVEYQRGRWALESSPAVPTVNAAAERIHHQRNYTYSEPNNGSNADDKEGGRKLRVVMDMFTALVLVVVSLVYTYPQS